MIVRIVLIIILVLLILTAIRKITFAWIKKKMMAKIETRFAGRRIIMMALNANFFGQKSKGAGQIRGNGALVLTEDELWFNLAAPDREITIPVNQIKSVKLKRSFLGKTVFRQLLFIEFSYRGQEESIAWSVNNPEKWRVAIEHIIIHYH